MVNGKLLQTNKKYSHLKQAQQEKIYQWMYEAYLAKYDEQGRFPASDDHEEILDSVMRKIDEAQIWIPYGEVAKHYHGKIPALRKRVNRELAERMLRNLEIEALDTRFSICKVSDYSDVDVSAPFVFTASTDEEKSLVCPESLVPENAVERSDGWRGFRICGTLDFSLIGVLARIAKILAGQEIGIFAISTFNTDYVLTKEEHFDKAIKAMQSAGYKVRADEADS